MSEDYKKNTDVEERKQFIRDWVKQNPLATSSSPLVAELRDKYPHVSAGGHRGMIGRVLEGQLPWQRGKKCPVEGCTTEAKDMAEALELFGHRYKKTQLQSYCKSCRNKHKKARRKAKREAEKAAQAQMDLEEEVNKKSAEKTQEDVRDAS